MPETVLHDEEAVRRLADALAGVPRVAYAGAHVYPAAAPDFEKRPLAARERVDHPFMRLYAHLPFCRYKCTFCYYAVSVDRDRARMERYVDALLRELEWVEPGTPLSQLFVGGGTPTAIPPDLLDRLLGTIFERMPRHGNEVHTVESSPDTVTEAHLDVLRSNGVGRVSMGIQSLDEPVLDRVHRGHGSGTALDAARMIIDAGLILNVDLMYGLPGQAKESFARDVARLADVGVHSLTLYDLRLSRNSPVAKHLSDEEWLSIARLMRWRSFVRETAETRGYTQTRWHTFKRLDGVGATHRRAPCNTEAGVGYQFGIGMSARSHLGSTVYRNHRALEVYVDRVERGESPVEHVFELDDEDRRTQHVARSLGDGLPLSRAAYEASFGNAIEDDFGPTIARLHAAGALADDGAVIELSERGKLVHDLVTLAFYPEPAQAWLREREHPELVAAG